VNELGARAGAPCLSGTWGMNHLLVYRLICFECGMLLGRGLGLLHAGQLVEALFAGRV
jgi:hypothetical protein